MVLFSLLYISRPKQRYGVAQGIGNAALLAAEPPGQYILMP
jgi:hypothetical protein